MDTLPILEFDIRGLNPKNKIKGEEWDLDPTCPWIIPNGSPFFGHYPATGEQPWVTVYDDAGRELKRNKDYFLEEEFIPLSEVCGKPITCFIRTSDEVRANSKKIKINYVSVGAYFVPRNQLKEWLEAIRHGKNPVDFYEKVLGVPETVPAEWHSHSGKTEVGDWFEFTLFFTYLAENLKTRNGGAINDQLELAAKEAFDRLVLERNNAYGKLRSHQDNYNKPHGILPKHVNMGNHPNYGTGNLQDHITGTRTDLLATPQGVQELVKTIAPNTTDAMRNGMVALSKHSNGTYIPPNITGSFEGLGSRSECMGICLEEDGRVVIIQNHFDGRNEGLYFSTLTGYDKRHNPQDPYEFVYTNYKYEPPVLINSSIIPDAIIMGSGNDLIMVGQTAHGVGNSDSWHLALTNNSFDPAGHRYIKTDMTEVYAAGTKPFSGSKGSSIPYHHTWSIKLIDDWAILMTWTLATDNTIAESGRLHVFRIPKADLIAGVPSRWQLLNLTYQDWDGLQRTNHPWFEFAQRQKDGNGDTVRWGWLNFSPIPLKKGYGYSNRRNLPLLAKKTGEQNTAVLNLIQNMFVDQPVNGGSVNPVFIWTNMVYDINFSTGQMTLRWKQQPWTLDYNDQSSWGAFRNNYIWFYDATVRYTKSAAVLTAKGEMLYSCTNDAAEFLPLNCSITYVKCKDRATGQYINTPEELLSGPLNTDRILHDQIERKYRDVISPIPIGMGSRQIAYDNDVECFVSTPTTVDKTINSPDRARVGARVVSGEYEQRPQVVNTTLSPLFSRPLVNTVYKTNLSTQESVLTITGSAAELAARGVQMGSMSLSSCSWSPETLYPLKSLFLPSAAFQAPDKRGTFLTFPKTHRREYDPATLQMNYIPNDHYGLAESVKAQLYSWIPAAKRGRFWSFNIYVLEGALGGMFTGFTTAIIHLEYFRTPDGNTQYADAKILHVSMNVEAPNANHGTYLITGFNIISDSGEYLQHEAMVSGRAGYASYDINRGLFSGYRDGNNMKISIYGGMESVGGTQYHTNSVINLNLTTGALSGVEGSHVGWQDGDPIAFMPKLGITDYTSVVYEGSRWINTYAQAERTNLTSGGACRIMPRVGNYYATLTAYPETAWTIFILEEVEVMFSGTLYRMPIGNIDLRDIDADPRNKVFYLYSTMEGQKPQYVLSDTKLRQTSKMLHAATITTGPNQILLIDRRQPFLIGDLEVSHNRKGGSIPVSSGFPQEEGNFTFLRAAELLP